MIHLRICISGTSNLFSVSLVMFPLIFILHINFSVIILQQALTLAMCPLAACLFEAVGPVRATTIDFPLARGASGFFFFLVLRMPPLFFTGNRQNSEGNVNSYLFFRYIYLGRPNVQKCATSRVKS